MSKSKDRLDGIRHTGLVEYPSPAEVIVPLYRLREVLLRGDRSIARKFGLTWGEFETLIALRTAPSAKQLTPSDLQNMLILTSGGMTKILKGLVQYGFVSLVTNKDDARSRFVHLTGDGNDLVGMALPELAAYNRSRLGDGLTKKEQVRLAGLLQKLLSSLES